MGRIRGRRGNRGELTVRVPAGDAAIWTGLTRVWIEHPGNPGRGEIHQIESCRAYRDRLVLKLENIDDAGAANELRGRTVMALREDAPQLPAGRHWDAELVGLEVVDAGGNPLGRVIDVLPTGGTDLLVVERGNEGGGEPLLVPLAEEIVTEISEREGRIRIDPPRGLLELNRENEA